MRFGDNETPWPILNDFLNPARNSGASVHLKNLYNDYVYFWRWALWKLCEQQDGGGIVSFITASSYLAGPGFVGMREILRRTFDELWIINLEGDSRGARRTENVFAIQTPVAIAIGVRQNQGDPNMPAKVSYSKVEGDREAKFVWLNAVERFDQVAWQVCPEGWHAPFLPKGHGDYFAWPLLTHLFPWQENGIQFKRSWPIGETADVLRRRWRGLSEANSDDRRTLFRETDARRHDAFYRDFTSGETLPSIEQELSSAVELHPQLYGFRTLDRHYALIDVRFADRVRPELCRAHSLQQLYLTSLFAFELGEGPAATITHLLPDLHHYCGRGGKDVVPLWRDAAATEANITGGIVALLQEVLAVTVRPEDLFAFAYSILANPGYVRQFWEELATPGPRLPIPKDANLFRRAVGLGRHLIWLHTYGERMVPDGERAEVPQGAARCLAAVPDEPMRYPEDFKYDPATREIRVGEGRFGPVAPKVYEFSVSGFEVVKSWLGYRMRRRAGRRSSPLDDVRPERWLARMTDEFLELLWVLEHTLAMYPQLDDLLEAVVAGPIFTADELPSPSEAERRPRQRRGNERQMTLL